MKTGLFLGFRPLAFRLRAFHLRVKISSAVSADLLLEKFSTPAGIDRPMAKSSEAKLPISQKERPLEEIEHAMHARAMREAHSSKGISEGRPSLFTQKRCKLSPNGLNGTASMTTVVEICTMRCI